MALVTRGFALALAVPMLGACGVYEPRGFGEAPTPTGPPATVQRASPASEAAQTLRVTALPGLRFDRRALEVRAGSVAIFELRNQDVEDHTLVINELPVAMLAGGGETVRSTAVAIAPGDRGTYTFFCSIADHREAGMEGLIRVGRP